MNIDISSLTFYEILNLIFFAVQTIATLLAVCFAYLAYRQAQKINKQQMEQTIKIHDEQQALARHQSFIPLSEQLRDLRYIASEDPNWEDVSEMSNLLEIIAVNYSEKIVNRKVLLTLYGRLFTEIFEQIFFAKDKDNPYRGKDILEKNCPLSVEFYHHLCDYYKIKNVVLASKITEAPDNKEK